VIVALALAAPILPLADPHKFVMVSYAGPSDRAWLGGDSLGRDNFSRAVWGGRLSLFVGVTAVVPAVLIGWTLTAIVVYRGGIVEAVLFRAVDAMQALPTIVIALAVITALGASLVNVVLTIGFVLIPGTARTFRGIILSTLSEQYVESARTVGCSGIRLLVRHILPNTASTIIVLISTMIPFAMVVEASLSFLGVGLPPGSPSWGSLLRGGLSGIYTDAPWTALAGGLPLTIAVLSFNMVGDMLRDQFDPRVAQ